VARDRRTRATFLGTEGKVFNDQHTSDYFLCHTSKPNNSTGQQVNNYEKAVVTTSVLLGQQCNNARATVHILLMSRDAIWTNCMQVFCVEV